MNIKDAYIHGTHGVVKNINVAIKESEPYDDSILYYTLADLNNTSHYVKLPLASATQNGLMSSLDKIKLNNLSTDAKHTAGSTNSDSKLFLIGATSQSANPQTYSHDTAYVGSNGFLYSNSKKVDMDLVVPLNAQGSRIPADADLNTVEYLKIGNYYCQYTSDAGTIKNCPVSEAFRMEVYSFLEKTPNESTPYANRLRKLTTVVGEQYIQHCYNSNNTEFTYGDWIYIPTVKAVMDTDTNGSITKVGDSATPVYINTNGNFEACTNVQSDISKAVDASTIITSQSELDAFIEAGKVKFAILSYSAELSKPILNGKDGLIVSHGWSGNSNFGYQMAYDDNGYNISFRYCNNGTWSPWKALTFEDHTHKYAGSDSAGGPANEVKISPGSSNVERNIVVANGNSLFTVPKVTGNYAAGTLTANYFKFNKWEIKHPEDNSNFWQAIFGETLPTGLTTVKPFRFDLSGGASPTTVSYNNNTVQLYNNHAASLIWTTYETFGYLNIPAYPREMDNVWIGGGNNNTEIGWSAKLFHSRKNLIPQEKDKYDVGSSEYKWKDVHATTFIGNLDGSYVNKLTGYTKTLLGADIAATDTLNTALSKLEYKADLAYKWVSSVTSETDTDEYVNKWDEIVDFLDSVKEGSDISQSFVTTATAQTITGLKAFQTKSTEDNKQAVALKLKNDGWLVDMSTAVDFYNGSMYTVPNARIETKMAGPGYRGGTLIFSTQSKEASGQNPNPNPLTERLTITDDGNSVFNTHILPSVTGTYDFGSSSYAWKNVYATTFTGNLSGNANTSTKTGISTIWLYPERQNEINFGGTNQSTTIYFGAYKKDERPIPQCFVFGGGTGTAEIKAKTFKRTDGTEVSYSGHTHNYLQSGGYQSLATVRDLTNFPATKTLFTGQWTSAGGYATNYGTTLDISFATWYQRLAFNTTGRIEYFRGINTDNSDKTEATLTKVGDLAYTHEVFISNRLRESGLTASDLAAYADLSEPIKDQEAFKVLNSGSYIVTRSGGTSLLINLSSNYPNSSTSALEFLSNYNHNDRLKVRKIIDSNRVSGGFKELAWYSDIPTIPTSLPNPYSLTIQGNGTTLENGVYDGSAAKTVNITPANIGALALSGGRLSTAANTILTLNSIKENATESGLKFEINSTQKGWVGSSNFGTYLHTYAGPHKLGIKNDGTGFIDENTIIHSGNYNNYALSLSGGTMTGSIASQTIRPTTTNTYNLGSSDYIWKNVYAAIFDGALRSKDIRELTGITSDFGDKTFTPFFSNVTMPTDNWWSGFTSKGWNNVYDSWQLVGFSGQGNTPIIDLHWRNGVDNVWNNWKRILDSSNYSNYALPLSGGAMIGAIDLTNSPNPEDEYKMGLSLLGSNSGGIHFKKLANAANDWGNAITWGYNDGDAASAGIYTKTSGSYGSKMYFATTNLFSDGPKAALEIDAQGNITALRNKFIGNLTGNATSSTKTGDGTNVLYVEKQNEINFGGTAVSSTIYFGYRETDSKVIPSKFVFGSKTGTAELVAKTFTGALQGNASSASMLVEIPIKTNTKYWVSTSSWTNTGYTFESLDAGTYAIQLTSDNLVASGIMSVLKNVTDTVGDEIPLHVYGTAGWRPYLRTRENKLQIASNDVSNTERTVTIKIARIL